MSVLLMDLLSLASTLSLQSDISSVQVALWWNDMKFMIRAHKSLHLRSAEVTKYQPGLDTWNMSGLSTSAKRPVSPD